MGKDVSKMEERCSPPFFGNVKDYGYNSKVSKSSGT